MIEKVPDPKSHLPLAMVRHPKKVATVKMWNLARVVIPKSSTGSTEMPLQVLALRVLATRQVLREKLDYTEYLAGNTKLELDTLDRLPGRFLVREAEVVVERLNQEGREVPKDVWETLVTRRMLRFLEGKGEFLIEETEGGKRTWNIEDFNFPFFTSHIDDHTYSSSNWVHHDTYIEDGKLVLAMKMFRPVGGRMILLCDLLDSFVLDDQENVVRKFVFKDFTFGSMVKVTKNMRALRVA